MDDLEVTEVKIKKKKRKSEINEENKDSLEPKAKKVKREPKQESNEDINGKSELHESKKINVDVKKLKEVKVEPQIEQNVKLENIDNTKVLWEVLATRCQPIANPLANEKLGIKIFKLIKKANKRKQLRKGVREVQKFIRKGEKGILILAGDTSPIDIISHLPVVSEDNNIPYCFVPSKEDLGSVCSTNRQTCCMLIKSHDEYKKLYDTIYSLIKLMPLPI